MNLFLPILIASMIIGAIVFILVREKSKEESIVNNSEYIAEEQDVYGYAREMLDVINQYRFNNGLSILIPEKLLNHLANRHCEQMIYESKISHHNAFKRKEECLSKGFTLYGEIVGLGFNNADSLFNAYLRSSKHNAIIEHDEMTHIGIGFCADLDRKVYNTVIFAKHDYNKIIIN